MKKYILSLIVAIVTMIFNHGKPETWTFEQFISAFLIGFFTIYHLELFEKKNN